MSSIFIYGYALFDNFLLMLNIRIYFYVLWRQEFTFLSEEERKYFLQQRGVEEKTSAYHEYGFFWGKELVICSGIEKDFDANDCQNHGAKTMKLIKKICKEEKIEEVRISLSFEGDGFLPSFTTEDSVAGEWHGEKSSWVNTKDSVNEYGFFGSASEWQEEKINVRLFVEKGFLMARQNDDRFKEKATTLVIKDEDIAGIKNTDLFPIVRGIELARSLTFQPANIINPQTIQEICEEELAKKGVTIKVYDKADLEKENMNLFLAVGRASSVPPRMLVLEYSPDEVSGENNEVFAFVGKGVTYDSGGLYLKSYPHMNEMHGDMWGAATVIGIMSSLQELGIKKRVVGAIGLVENMPDSNAYKNGEIITSKSGKTVYINHSDAEWRLVLADMMTFVEENYTLDAIVDIATLTGAVMRALGEMYTGVIGNNAGLISAIKEQSKQTNEWVWELPLDKLILKSLEHPLADVDNIGKYVEYFGAQAGAGFVAKFLKDSSKWVHCDIAGSCLRDKMRQDYDLEYGLGTGALVHLFLEVLRG